ncbi:MAG: RsmB/NOP family class I SAM-dependent RNA methyltransferase [Pseudomonadota bacterium]
MSELFLTSRLRSAVFDVLTLYCQGELSLDKAYSNAFFNKPYSSTDHARITQIVGDIVRRLNAYAFVLECAEFDIVETEDRLDQLLFVWCVLNKQKRPAFIEPSGEVGEQLVSRIQTLTDQPVLLDGCPDWLDQLGGEQLGERWVTERATMALAPTRFIRANTLKTSRDELREALQQESIETENVNDVPSALKVVSDSALFKSDAFQAGRFEQQDAGSQLVAHALDVQPKMRVVDACAGAGGKTLALAALMQSKGRLLALDTEDYKLDTLKQRAKRAAAHNVETRVITSSKVIKRLKESADRVLLDVPCSGSGVFRRNPDAKWQNDVLTQLPKLTALQGDILMRYSNMVKDGGVLMYATCSIFPIENEQQVSAFLATRSDFELLEEVSISPAETGFDGFYWATMKRTLTT